MIIRPDDHFFDEEHDRLVVIKSRHFSDFDVEIWTYDESSDKYVYDHNTIFTESEIRRLTNSKSITFLYEEGIL